MTFDTGNQLPLNSIKRHEMRKKENVKCFFFAYIIKQTKNVAINFAS